jgi:hypothetical protein
MGNLLDELVQVSEVEIEHDETYLAGSVFVGDMPIAWFNTAIKLRGNTFKVAMLIWHYGKLRKSPVRVSMSKCRQIGIERRARNKALQELCDAGLIAMTAADNRAPVVTIIRK